MADTIITIDGKDYDPKVVYENHTCNSISIRVYTKEIRRVNRMISTIRADAFHIWMAPDSSQWAIREILHEIKSNPDQLFSLEINADGDEKLAYRACGIGNLSGLCIYGNVSMPKRTLERLAPPLFTLGCSMAALDDAGRYIIIRHPTLSRLILWNVDRTDKVVEMMLNITQLTEMTITVSPTLDVTPMITAIPLHLTYLRIHIPDYAAYPYRASVQAAFAARKAGRLGDLILAAVGDTECVDHLDGEDIMSLYKRVCMRTSL